MKSGGTGRSLGLSKAYTMMQQHKGGLLINGKNTSEPPYQSHDQDNKTVTSSRTIRLRLVITSFQRAKKSWLSMMRK
jgi:hypothetical protein